VVFTTKHHEGFAMWPSKVRPDFNIAATPWKAGKGDVLKELADACHAKGMRLGWYYSPRDWTHPDYGVGDDARYEADMKTHLTEILSNYGKVDLIWWDSFGQGDSFAYWHADQILGLVRKLQPGIITNNRCSFYPETNRKGLEGDFDTPEQTIGKYQVDRPWESCITLVGHNWSFRPGGSLMSSDRVIETLVSCATGGGNLLLNVGPMPDGRIEPRQAEVLRQVGKWMKQYGETIYATQGGPFRNGRWGGATFKGDTLYLHALSAAEDNSRLPALKGNLVSARNLTGGPVKATTDKDGRINVVIPKDGRTRPDTIIALTLDRPVERVNGEVEMANSATLGLPLLDTKDATCAASSLEDRWSGEKNALLKGGAKGPFAFHTKDEKNPSITIDLKAVKHVDAVEIRNRQDMLQERAQGLTLEVSEDGVVWTKVWQADTVENVWVAVPTQHVAGADIKGASARYLRLAVSRETPTPLHLKAVKIYGY
jgi:alpha-L-fucosidase